MSETLYDRIGGEPAVNAAVDRFYRKVLGDKRLNPFFDNTDMARQRSQQKAFLTMVFGGPNNYDGRDLTEAHSALVDRGLNDSHFDAVAGHLMATLWELKVPEPMVKEAMAVAGGARDAVLGR